METAYSNTHEAKRRGFLCFCFFLLSGQKISFAHLSTQTHLQYPPLLLKCSSIDGEKRRSPQRNVVMGPRWNGLFYLSSGWFSRFQYIPLVLSRCCSHQSRETSWVGQIGHKLLWLVSWNSFTNQPSHESSRDFASKPSKNPSPECNCQRVESFLLLSSRFDSGCVEIWWNLTPLIFK